MEECIPFKINTEYEKNPLLKQEDVAALRNWASTTPHCPSNVPDVVLLLFLNCAEYDVEKAKIYIQNFYKVRAESPELFSDRDPHNPNLTPMWELIHSWMAPKTVRNNLGVLYAGFLSSDATNYDLGEAMKAFLMIGEAFYLRNRTAPGFIVVLDPKGMTYRHILKIRINILSKFFFYIQEAMPIQIVEVHVVNVSPLVDKLMFLARPFIKKSLLDRLHFHSDIEDIFKLIPQDTFPPEIGGTSTVSRDDIQRKWLNELESLREWFIQEETVRLSVKKQSQPEVEEVQQSFKKLDFD